MGKFQMKMVVKKLFSGDEENFHRWFQNQIRRGTDVMLVFTPNPEQVVLAGESEAFAQHLLSADVLLPDGVGLVLTSRLLGKRVSRLTGADTLSWWLQENARMKIPTLLVGGRGGVAELVAKKFDPEGQWCWGTEGHLNVAVAHDPAYQDQFLDEEKALFDLIREKKPKVLFVAFGAPWQEEFLTRHREQLSKLGVRVAMVCGGSFDYVAGIVPRAPQWMQSAGLEWLYRLKKEPWRWRRQVKLLHFLRQIYY